MTAANISAIVALGALILFIMALLWPEPIDGSDPGALHLALFYGTFAVAALAGVATLIFYLAGA